MSEEASSGATFSRTHGLQLPWDRAQIISWFLFPFFLVHFCVVTAPLLRPPLSHIFIPLYGVLSSLSVILNVMAVLSNASDPGIATRLDDMRLSSVERPAGQTSCFLCRAYVHRSSKHCRNCNKCVVGFDHHCRWLNNCVGERNYHKFFLFMMFTLATVTIQLALLILQFADSFLHRAEYESDLHELYRCPVLVFQILVAMAGCLALVTVVLLGQLFLFHIMLLVQGKTTYEWILARRERKRRKREQAVAFLRLHAPIPNAEEPPRPPLPDAGATPPQPTATTLGKGSRETGSEESSSMQLFPGSDEPSQRDTHHPFLVTRDGPAAPSARAGDPSVCQPQLPYPGAVFEDSAPSWESGPHRCGSGPYHNPCSPGLPGRIEGSEHNTGCPGECYPALLEEPITLNTFPSGSAALFRGSAEPI